MKLRSLLASVALFFAFVLVASTPPPVFADKKSSDSDVSMEVVGAVFNASPAASIQYGYITYINGLENVFSGSPQNETTALFTFYNDTSTVRVINNGPLRIVNRVGTFTVYLDNTPDGDFSNPDSFRDGTPVMMGSLRHQVVVNTTTNTFTTTFVITVTSTEVFFVDQGSNRRVRLGKEGQKLRLTVFGQPSTSGPGQFVIAGYVAGGDLTR
jgi:hypothetical protein